MRFILSYIFLCVVLFPSGLQATNSDFVIKTFVGVDNTPPTTPVLQTVIPVTSTQIDITWSASVDDVLVSGYRLFRDSVQIATTTLLSYSDNGLVASTSYIYFVEAFDIFGNVSPPSTAVATTTLQNPSIAKSTTSSGGRINATGAGAMLIDINIITKKQSALFLWETTVPTRYTLMWGRTTSYELGTVAGNIFKQNHVTNIVNLEPGTKYYYKLLATNSAGLVSVISTASFITESEFINNQISNVRSFTAVAEGVDASLSWQNTFTQSDNFVRVVRSHLFYPDTIQSGAVVYEGQAESFIDKEALLKRSPQYYTIFVLDSKGRVSSGAVAKVFLGSVTPGSAVLPAEVGDDTVLRAVDISVRQQEKTYSFIDEIELYRSRPFLVSIPYEALPKNLKSIIISVQDPTNNRDVSTYLLKLNQAGDAYTAIIAGKRAVGAARLTIEVFDYEQATVRRISTTILFTDDAIIVPFFPDRILYYTYYGIPIIFLASLIFWLITLNKRLSKIY